MRKKKEEPIAVDRLDMVKVLDNTVEVWTAHYNRAKEYLDKAEVRMNYAKLRRDTWIKKGILMPENAKK